VDDTQAIEIINEAIDYLTTKLEEMDEGDEEAEDVEE